MGLGLDIFQPGYGQWSHERVGFASQERSSGNLIHSFDRCLWVYTRPPALR
jgi:hypothetical protein